jgi:membrane protein YdbS with pleckstrin-like domain
VPLSRKFLNDDEELLVELRPHWVFMFGPLAASIVTVGAVVAILIALGNSANWATYPFLAIAAVPVVWLLARVVRWRLYILALTTTRIVLRRGILDRDTIQLRLQRITEINLSQQLWERVLGTGRLIIDVQGEDDSLILEFVRKPAVVQRVINSQINELTGGGAAEPIPEELRPREPHPPPAPASSAPSPSSPPPPSSRPRSDDTPPYGIPTVDHEPESGTGPGYEPEVATAAAPSAPSAGATHVDIRDRLIELDDLRQRGILSEAEFAAKKAELLNRI